ncbi:MAG: glycosyltransferase family 1 protein [Eubacteriales bacterium]|nr:glycosyltransferase family 1 protein [Eubacteriales bacterium]
MREPIRVLQVLGGTGLGGAESRVMDLYRNMDRDRVQFDFAVHTEKKGYFDDEIRRLGGRIYPLPRFRIYNWRAYRRAWKRFFETHPGYACVHGHMTSTAALYLPAAKRGGAALTVAHARSAGTDRGAKGLATRLLRRGLWKKADICLACSALAGQAVFGKRAWERGLVHVVPNAIEVEKYAYDPEKREKMRGRLGLSDRFVVGHVGRFNVMKNHLFLVEVFHQICRKRPDATLLLLGEGDCMEAARRRAEELSVSERVIFAGNKGNAEDYYQAMDLLIFPSLYEGLPGTVLEAQAAGLPCLMSDTITGEVALTELVETESLGQTAQEWAKRALALTEKAGQRRSRLEQIRAAGFDAKQQALSLEQFYRTGKGEGLWR